MLGPSFSPSIARMPGPTSSHKQAPAPSAAPSVEHPRAVVRADSVLVGQTEPGGFKCALTWFKCELTCFKCEFARLNQRHICQGSENVHRPKIIRCCLGELTFAT